MTTGTSEACTSQFSMSLNSFQCKIHSGTSSHKGLTICRPPPRTQIPFHKNTKENSCLLLISSIKFVLVENSRCKLANWILAKQNRQGLSIPCLSSQRHWNGPSVLYSVFHKSWQKLVSLTTLSCCQILLKLASEMKNYWKMTAIRMGKHIDR